MNIKEKSGRKGVSLNGHNVPLTATRLAVPDLLAVLRKAGSREVSEEALRAHGAAGAPTNADGTVNLVHYAAWLVRELARRGD